MIAITIIAASPAISMNICQGNHDTHCINDVQFICSFISKIINRIIAQISHGIHCFMVEGSHLKKYKVMVANINNCVETYADNGKLK
jgi:D-mannonate dehydratase